MIPAELDELHERVDLKVPASQVERFIMMEIEQFAKLRFLKRRRRN